MCTPVQASVFCHVLCCVLLTDQLINSVVSQSACFVKHSCSHTWGKLCCVKEEVSASLWGILLTGQQVHDSLTRSLHQLCVSVFVRVCEHVETKWQKTRAQGKLTELGKSSGDSGEPKAACCCLSRLLSRGNFEKLFVCSWILKAKGRASFFCLSSEKKALQIDSAFHTVLSGLAFNSRRTVFTNWCSAPLGL